jgi:hypothetical protein
MCLPSSETQQSSSTGITDPPLATGYPVWTLVISVPAASTRVSPGPSVAKKFLLQDKQRDINPRDISYCWLRVELQITLAPSTSPHGWCEVLFPTRTTLYRGLSCRADPRYRRRHFSPGKQSSAPIRSCLPRPPT